MDESAMRYDEQRVGQYKEAGERSNGRQWDSSRESVCSNVGSHPWRAAHRLVGIGVVSGTLNAPGRRHR